eukprot:scaffold3221_cov126-Skeletonema_marinoi.AAC.16
MSTEETAAISDAPSGHLRRCRGANTINKSLSRETDASILSRPTMMEETAAISDAPSGHLRRCSGANTINKSLSRETDASILSRPTMMGH